MKMSKRLQIGPEFFLLNFAEHILQQSTLQTPLRVWVLGRESCQDIPFFVVRFRKIIFFLNPKS